MSCAVPCGEQKCGHGGGEGAQGGCVAAGVGSMDAWLAPGACAAQLLVMCALQQGRPLWAWRGGAPANSTGIRKCGRCVARGKSTMAAKMCELHPRNRHK